MELRQLNTFRTLARTLSFTRTAAALNYVQSNVTAQIQALEEELGVQLFDRLGRHVILTDAGRCLLGYAEKILSLEEEARTTLSAETEPAGSLTFSAPETLCTYRLPAVLQQFRARFPRVKLTFRPLSDSAMRRSVSEGIVDVTFVLEESLQAGGLVVEPLRREPLLVLAYPEHPLTQLSQVRPADLEGESVLLTELGCSYRNVFRRVLAAVGVHPNENMEMHSVEAIKQWVMAGMGITVLPEVAVTHEIAQGQLVALPWNEPDFAVTTHMLWHKEKWQSPALSAFLSTAREVLGATEPVLGGIRC